VAPGLFLGGRRTPPPPGVVTVVDLVAELPELRALRSVPSYRSYPVLDRWAPEPEELRGWLEEIERLPEPILVHCAAGKGRSAMLAAALLVKRGVAADIAGAEGRLREARPGVRLHPVQRRVARTAVESPAIGGGPEGLEPSAP
jgi:protein-tyrosine phosphatase